MRVFIGYDVREAAAAQVAEDSLRRRASVPIEVTFLRRELLMKQGLLRRPTDTRGGLWDLASGAPMATEFALSRFLVPMLAQDGWALFVDCDMVFLGDVAELMLHADPRYAVQVVKHYHPPKELTKMDGAPQTFYPRKNWSSVILWNASHHANHRLTLDAVNNWPGRDLHAFSWLADDEIGALPPAWNWLVGVQPWFEGVKLAHFTLGGPWFPDWSAREHDDIWLAAAEEMRRGPPVFKEF